MVLTLAGPSLDHSLAAPLVAISGPVAAKVTFSGQSPRPNKKKLKPKAARFACLGSVGPLAAAR
ncbi:hypothetical protein P7K49_024727 [Saguinus oedipus]|uniref:Uncharacterized protein n=1 Tax=Saguinus oedipus TaxID=9490 RepID=A0ABQ9UR15_SAGOE|nr:hypothetical protein P7K49_024727 [Saguinus oedipus]